MGAYAEVILDVPGRELDRPLDYRIPDDLAGSVRPGMIVEVPLGPRRVRGYVVGLKESSDLCEEKVRDIGELLSECGAVREDDLSLARWVAEEYCAPLRDTLPLFLPPGSLGGESLCFLADATDAGGSVGLSRAPRQAAVFACLSETGRPVSTLEIRERFGEAGLAAARSLVGRGLVRMVTRDRSITKAKAVAVYELAKGASEAAAAADGWTRRAPQRAATLRTLIAADGSLTVASLVAGGGSAAALRDLVRLGWVRSSLVRSWRVPDSYPEAYRRPILNEAQTGAVAMIVERLASGTPDTILLHGVTGSGKTEVYLQAVEDALNRGRGALVLVPEIALTPQTSARFRARFGERVAVLHSRLSTGERFDEWERVSSGEADVVLGARSAVFAPVRNLGLVIVDEEHEGSYKQEDSPRYHAVEVAVKRAELSRSVTVLGSATPSIESCHRAREGRYKLAILPARATGASLPRVSVVDMREELARGNRGMFSQRLHDGIAARLLAGEQTILFLNRRGYARVVLCRACGLTLQCPHCGVALTYHVSTGRVVCHYCDYSRPVPTLCPQCKSGYIRHFGVGTERVEEEVLKAFPGVRAARMDVDTTQRKGAHARILDAFRRGDHDVLIGTQMVAKGLDFPNVTLVGVVAADTGLRLPDYRAAERTFQLLAQVAGRAGRGSRPGEVVVQTYAPEHYAVRAAAAHDYETFYAEEISFRRSLGYPPFGEIVLVTTAATDEAASRTVASELASALSRGTLPGVEVRGPLVAPLARLRGRYRHQVVLKGGFPGGWQESIMDAVRSVKQRYPEVVAQVNVRPQSLL